MGTQHKIAVRKHSENRKRSYFRLDIKLRSEIPPLDMDQKIAVNVSFVAAIIKKSANMMNKCYYMTLDILT